MLVIGCATAQPEFVFGLENMKCRADAASFTELSAVRSEAEGLTVEGAAWCTDEAGAKTPFAYVRVEMTSQTGVLMAKGDAQVRLPPL